MIGEVIGNYRIVRELGAGGMGSVYEGVDVMVERPVAIKMLRAEIARQPELIERFRGEAVTLAKLNHPCIAALYSFFRERDNFYMVMEFVPGRTLEALLKDNGSLDPRHSGEVMCRILDGMAHAHAMGILHRDIKPANVILTPDGKVKVTDFGIARVLGTSRMTREGRIIGTLEYIAPERIKGEEADIRSDLYSAGVVLFEMLTGRLPFVSDTDFGLMQAHLNQPPPELGGLGVDCPPAMESVVRRALEKDPANRFQSAERFAEAIRQAQPAEYSPTAPTREVSVKPTRLAGVPQPVKETRLAAPAAGSGNRKPPLRWILVAAGVMAAAVFLGVVLWVRAGRQPASNAVAVPPPVQETAQPQPAAEPAPQLPPQVQEAVSGKEDATVKGGNIAEALDGTALRPANSAPDPRAAEEKRKAALRALEGDGKADAAKDAEAKRREALRALEK